jgi:signal transduction histidine kinase/DNA-binding response OmpR family regulator/ligand-binding sensor domain-containing protein
MDKFNFSYITVLLFFLSIPTLPLFAQKPTLNHYPICDIFELSHYQTKKLYQDSKGFIWIGTLGGLDRWDGSHIRKFVFTPFSPSGIPAVRIFSMLEDDNNNLWVGAMFEGLIKYNLETETFTSYFNHQIHPLKWRIECISKLDSNTLWLGTNYGVFKYYINENHFESVPIEDYSFELKKYGFYVSAIVVDKSSKTWIGTANGLYYFDEAEQKFTHFEINSEFFKSGHLTEIWEMKCDQHGIIWILQGKAELIRFNPKNGDVNFIWPRKFESLTSYADGGLCVTSSGKVLFGTDRDIFEYDTLSMKISSISQKPLWISDIFEDRDGNIIVATWRGVNILDKKSSKIKLISNEYIGHTKYVETYITDYLLHNEDQWFSTFQSGAIRIDLKTNERNYYRKATDTNGLSSNSALRILLDKSKNVWIWAGRDLHKFNKKTNNFIRHSFNNNHIVNMDNDGIIWLVGVNSVIKFNPIDSSKIITNLNPPLPLNESNFGVDDYGLIKDPEGNIWVGSQITDGLIKIDIKNSEWKRYQFNNKNPLGLPSNIIHRILLDSKNRIWVGTKIGLCQMVKLPEKDSIIFKTYTTEDGLADNEVCGLTEDDSGNIWVGTFKGISVIKPNGTIENLTAKDGLPSEDPFIWLLNKDSKGNIIAGIRDLVEIHPDYVEPNNIIPEIYITDIKLFGKSIIPSEKSQLKKSILFTDQINLKHNENFIRIEFSALNFNHPEKNQYKYIMAGVDKDTIYGFNKNYAEYTALRPGKYTFWVTGSNNANVWNTAGISLHVNISPPWYRSMVAYAMYSILLFYLIIWYRNQLIKRGREKAELQLKAKEVAKMKEIDTLKSQFFSNISHEFRTPLTLILGNVDNLEYTHQNELSIKSAYQLIRRNGIRLLKLVNQLLDLSKLDAKLYDLQVIQGNIFNSIRIIASSFTSLSENKGIEFTQSIPIEDIDAYYDSDILEKVLYNLLSNAFKFTPAKGKVALKAEKVYMESNFIKNSKTAFVHIQVSDTGIGIAEENLTKIFDRFYQVDKSHKTKYEGTGVGLSLSKELIMKCKGEISITSAVGMGSTFDVYIPIDSICYSDEEKIFTRIPTANNFLEQDLTCVPYDDYKEEPSAFKNNIILVVEDNTDMNKFIVDIFKNDYSVYSAFDGNEGVRFAVEQIPDLIITDLMMPDIDGLELCKTLKENEKTSHIPIIMLTAKATINDKVEGLETGADDFISKPFETIELKVRAKNLINQRQKLHKKYSKIIMLEPSNIEIKNADEVFINKLKTIIAENISSECLGVEFLSMQLGYSRVQLYRKIKALTGNSVQILIRNFRLKRAAILIEQKYGSISEVAFEVGFSNLSHFSRCFREQFGVLPSEYFIKD